MKLGRETKGIPSADLLVCFPSRSHLALMPSSNKQRSHRRHHCQRKSMESPATGSEMSEPSSPKVSCAGQIKIRPKNSKSWQSVMEEIERIHDRKKLQTKRFYWVESFGFKKDITEFLTCLCSFRFDFRCFRTFPEADFTTEEEEEEEGIESYRTAFSKWFMVLQENGVGRERNSLCTVVDGGSIEPPMAAPPKNALLLMRCRSAPAKKWLEVKEEVKVKKSLKCLMEEENKESLVMEMGPELCKISSDIGKETWIVGENRRDWFSRSRSWKV